MVEVKVDKDGKVVAYCEWNLLDRNGHFDNKGEQVWVQDIWIHSDYRNNGIIRHFIGVISHKKAPWAKYCKFRRGKHNNRISLYGKGIITKEVHRGRN